MPGMRQEEQDHVDTVCRYHRMERDGGETVTKFSIRYTITGDNASDSEYITDDPSEFVPRMRKEYGERIKFKIRRLEE